MIAARPVLPERPSFPRLTEVGTERPSFHQRESQTDRTRQQRGRGSLAMARMLQGRRADGEVQECLLAERPEFGNNLAERKRLPVVDL